MECDDKTSPKRSPNAENDRKESGKSREQRRRAAEVGEGRIMWVLVGAGYGRRIQPHTLRHPPRPAPSSPTTPPPPARLIVTHHLCRNGTHQDGWQERVSEASKVEGKGVGSANKG